MSKRKKLRTSGGEGVHPPKPPKNSRRGNADGAPQTSELDCLPFPKSIEGKSGPTSSAELNGEELAQAASRRGRPPRAPSSRPVSSFPGEHVSGGERGRVEEAASLQLKRAQPPGARQCARWGWKARTGEKLPERVGSCLPLRPHSSLSPFLPGSCCIPFQNSLGKLVPQSAKPRKTVTRQAETRGEDVATRASHPVRPENPPHRTLWACGHPDPRGQPLCPCYPSTPLAACSPPSSVQRSTGAHCVCVIRRDLAPPLRA
nr:break repair meiotic recombinase recruitment factor 1 [Dasypus novemcinctus]